MTLLAGLVPTDLLCKKGVNGLPVATPTGVVERTDRELVGMHRSRANSGTRLLDFTTLAASVKQGRGAENGSSVAAHD
jgi:hypothetical protein